MIETGWGKVCDKLIFVDAPRARSPGAIGRKHGWSEKEVTAREKMQTGFVRKESEGPISWSIMARAVAAVSNQVREVLQRLDLTAHRFEN